MKKNIIALAITATFAVPMAAQAAPTLYGQINMAIAKDSQDRGMVIDSIASRMGVKGSNKLGNGLKAIYKIEFGVGIDDATTLKSRNQYVGLAGGFGVVLAGRHDTPLKMSQPKDLFNDGTLDNAKMTNIGFGNSEGGEDRVSQTLAYVSPTFSNTKIVVALVPNEANDDSTILNTYSLAVMHGSKKKGLYLAAALNGADSDSGDQTYMRLSGQYASGGLIANAMYQNSDAANAEGSNIMVGVAYKMGKMMPKLKYSINSEDKNSGKEGNVIALGLDYSLAKNTTAYVEVANFDSKFSNAENIGAIGLLHKF